MQVALRTPLTTDKEAAMPVESFTLPESLKHIEVIGHQQSDLLEVFHLRWPVEGGLEYATLDEALGVESIEVIESTKAGEVSQITVVNRSERMTFLMAGEQLVGCKQNRVVNSSLMVPPKAEIRLPVTCVERGRWGYTSSTFTSGRTSSYYALRAMMHGHTSQGYRAMGAPVSNQGQVWGEVSRKLESMGSSSRSDAMQDLYRNYDAKLNDLEGKLPATADGNGVAFVVNGWIVGIDLFDKAETLRKLWPKLIRSSSIDALEPPRGETRSITAEGVLKWLESGSNATQEPFQSPGLGLDVRIEGPDVVGAGLVVDDHPVHMELFKRTEKNQSAV
jgi:hypothetical protein